MYFFEFFECLIYIFIFNKNIIVTLIGVIVDLSFFLKKVMHLF